MKNDTMSAALEVTNLKKTYPGAQQPAVDIAELTVQAGDFFGLLGPNGSGKTTLLSMLVQLLAPDRGEIRISPVNRDESKTDLKALVGFVPQSAGTYSNLTAGENLKFFGSMYGFRSADLETRINNCLETVRLTEARDVQVKKFSGGMQRRLALAIGIIHAPRVLILDEPTVGIDLESRIFIYEKLKEMNTAGMTIIYTSHHLEEVEQLCKTIAVLEKGQIITRGSMRELLQKDAFNTLEFRLSLEDAIDLEGRLSSLNGVQLVERNENSIFLQTTDSQGTLEELMRFLKSEGVLLYSLTKGSLSLERYLLNQNRSKIR